jgi:hypothetical protein
LIIIGTPHSRNAGYYLNDDINGKAEADVRTCPHCQAIIKMQEWAKAPIQNFCLKCMAPACNHEACFDCVPFVKKIDMFTDAIVKYQQFLKMAGLNPVDPPSIITTGL